jgi:uncharacterized protein YkwD
MSDSTRVRRLLAVLAVLFAFVALAGPGLTGSAAAVVGDCTPASAWPAAKPDFAARVVDLVNAHRATKGLKALKVSPTLTGSSVWKARHMAQYLYMQHDDPAPPVARTVAQRLAACAYAGGGWGENIAYGYSTPEAVVQAWLNSPGHRANIENGSYAVIGVGAAATSTGRVYWAQNFGTLDDSGATSPPPPSAPPVPSSPVTVTPSSVTVQRGTLSSGGVSRLAANDSSVLQVSSSSGQTLWYGRMNSIPNTARSLQVTYDGSNSASCSQTISIWSWTRGVWVTVDTRTVGTTDALIVVSPTGTLADYVSGSSGSGDVAVRVGCSRSGSFVARGDFMKIVYTT